MPSAWTVQYNLDPLREALGGFMFIGPNGGEVHLSLWLIYAINRHAINMNLQRDLFKGRNILTAKEPRVQALFGHPPIFKGPIPRLGVRTSAPPKPKSVRKGPSR